MADPSLCAVHLANTVHPHDGDLDTHPSHTALTEPTPDTRMGCTLGSPEFLSPILSLASL